MTRSDVSMPEKIKLIAADQPTILSETTDVSDGR